MGIETAATFVPSGGELKTIHCRANFSCYLANRVIPPASDINCCDTFRRHQWLGGHKNRRDCGHPLDKSDGTDCGHPLEKSDGTDCGHPLDKSDGTDCGHPLDKSDGTDCGHPLDKSDGKI
ncbi:hypothetical protein BgiBS90_014550, partial [Biomphalaria glabrata]